MTGASKAPQWFVNWIVGAGDLNSGQIALDFQALADDASDEATTYLVAANNVAISLGMDHTLLNSLLTGLGII